MADLFPRTMVGGISMPRMLIGSNWFLGFSHTSLAKDRWIKQHQTADRIADIMEVFLDAGIDAVMGPAFPLMKEAATIAEERTGRKMILIVTPHLNPIPGEGDPETEAEPVFDQCAVWGATFCMPHQCVTDALLDKLTKEVRDIDRLSVLIRERGMIPGLSTHAPETIPYVDARGSDVETYVQIYNAAGFMMPLEADWELRIIREAKKPVMTIKPLAAGRLLPVVGLAFVWSTLRDQDMVTIGTTTPDEAREVIDLSLDLLSRAGKGVELQRTRSKASLTV
jgi:hypothetical protein